MPPLVVAAHTASCAAGVGLAALGDALRSNTSGLQALQADAPPAWAGTATVPEAWAGALDALVAAPLPPPLASWDCRPTRLAFQALQQDGFITAVEAARERWGAARVGLVLGTSASTIGDSEAAYRQLDAEGGFPAGRRNPRLNTPHALAAFVQQALGLQGPAVTVSTACSSSAKACGSARRWRMNCSW